MLRLPTLINFPRLFYSRVPIDEESTALLSESKETKRRNLGSITPTPIINETCFIYPNTSNQNFWVDDQIYQELLALFKFAIPLVITFLVAIGMRVIDVWFLGKLGSQAMAVVSLGGLFTTITGLSIGQGILTAIDTLVAQAFTGASNPQTVGIILQRGLIIMYIFGVFVAILWSFAEPILLYMNQTPELARMAQEFILIVIPNIFLSFTSVALRKFLQGLGEMKVTMYLILFLFPINIVSNYFFLIYLGLGYIGAAYHTVFMALVLFSVYILFILNCTDAKKYWPGLTMQALNHWAAFLKLGIPGMLSISTDWAFEVCAIMTGVLGQTSLAAQSVVLICNTWLLMIPSAITTALVVRLGHHLGANQPKKTKLSVVLATTLGLIFVSVNSVLMYTYRVAIATTFSTDDQVIVAIEELMGVGSLSHFALGFGIVLSGTLNAFGKQHIVATFNIVSYYMIGLPFGLYMMSHYNWGLVGVWSGVVLSGVLKSIGEGIVIVFFVDWEKECFYAAKRINKQEV